MKFIYSKNNKGLWEIMVPKIDKTKAKQMVGDTAARTVKFTMTMIKIVFIIVIIYTIAVAVWIYYDQGLENFLTNIATISIGGFWAFFLGYFGWRLGQSIEVYFYDIRKRNK